ncbi:hypothetical protein ACSLOL_27195, partial [Escherichia coli]
VAKLDEGHRLAALWQALPEELRLSPHRYLATNSPQGPWWLLGWCERVPEADEVLPAPLPPYRVLTGLVDRFGRTQRYHHDLTGKLIRSEDEGLVTHWHYDEADRLTHRTVKGETAERWQYDERGWLTDISHISEGHRVAVHYRYDEKGRLTGERQTVHHPQTEALLWQHETRHAYNAQGLANRCIPDSLPAVEWLTYGSGYLAGMKLGDTPLVEYTRDRLHRETLRSFGRYELTTAYTPAGQLQ